LYVVTPAGIARTNKNTGLLCPTALNAPFERKGQFRELSNRFSALTTKQISADEGATPSALKTAVNRGSENSGSESIIRGTRDISTRLSIRHHAARAGTHGLQRAGR
jgi:hypothetical protein